MLCEKYKPTLIEAAVSDADLPPAVRAHAESCATCAAELTQQRSLVAAIDANLHRQMNAPIPAATLHRLEAHFAQQPQPKRKPRFAQIFAATLTTLAVATALFLVFLSHWNVETLGPSTKTNIAPSYNSNLGQIQVHVGPPPQTATTPTPPPAHSRTVLASTAAAHHSEPEVLVPPDERIALEHFMADSRGRADFAVVLARRVPQQELHISPLDTPDIQTASVSVPSIQDSNAVAADR
jgi:hypothetical protein